MTATGANPPRYTFADLKAKKKRRELTHTLITDDDAAAALAAADERLRRARFSGDPDELAAAQAAHDDAEAAVRESAIVMRLRALPRKGDNSFAALKAEHPPTADDDARVQEASGNPKDKAIWHSDTFGPALVAASLVDPVLTAEQAAEIAEELNEGEWSGLYMAALNVNQSPTDTGGLVFS